jgi:hypothetical protein
VGDELTPPFRHARIHCIKRITVHTHPPPQAIAKLCWPSGASTEVVPMGGSIKTTEVALGRAAMFMCPPENKMSLWDACAPQVAPCPPAWCPCRFPQRYSDEKVANRDTSILLVQGRTAMEA